MNYLNKPYTHEALERLQVGSTVDIDGAPYCSLRAHVRRAVECRDIKQPLTGVQIAGMNRAACVAALMGAEVVEEEKETVPASNGNGSNGSNGHGAVESVISPATPTPSQGGNAVASAMAILAQAFGGNVSADEIARQVKQHAEPILREMAGMAGILKQEAESSKTSIAEALRKVEAENDKLRSELRAGKPVTIEIVQSNGEKKNIGRKHFLFPLLVKIVAARCHAYLAGPAGSFKTSTAHAIAEALELPFYATSVCQQTTKTDLLGFFVPGTGEYMATDFRRAFEHGGVFCLDEIDAGNANVLAVLNAALANDRMGFPDGMITRHKDFILVAAGNTFGQGANRQYVGRNQLDAATLDRFAFVEFPYDGGLEAEYCGIEGRPSPSFNILEGGSVTADGWLDYVARVREAADKLQVRAVFSTRASIMGVKLAAQGIGRAWLERLLIWKGMDNATEKKVRAALKA